MEGVGAWREWVHGGRGCMERVTEWREWVKNKKMRNAASEGER